MASPERAILAEIRTALQADLGDYVFTTSGRTPRVVIGEAPAPPRLPPTLPYIYLYAPAQLDDAYGEAPMREYDETAEIDFVAYAPTTSDDNSERVLDGCDLGWEIRKAVTAAHINPANTTLYGLLRLLARQERVLGQEADLPQGVVMVLGTILYRRISVGGL